jgi:hypothetical protein
MFDRLSSPGDFVIVFTSNKNIFVCLVWRNRDAIATSDFSNVKTKWDLFSNLWPSQNIWIVQQIKERSLMTFKDLSSSAIAFYALLELWQIYLFTYLFTICICDFIVQKVFEVLFLLLSWMLSRILCPQWTIQSNL